MPTVKSNALKDDVLTRLQDHLGKPTKVVGRYRVLSYQGKRANVRVTTKKAGDKYWFDVTPVLYEKKLVDYFLFACGSPDKIFVFPAEQFVQLIDGAHIGGVNQVPNFTIFLDSYEFEPAGCSHDRHNIKSYLNNYALFAN